MPKYIVETDGTPKGTKVTVDGKPVENISNVSASLKHGSRTSVCNIVVWAQR